MTLRDFIRANREDLQRSIKRALNHVPATASCDCPRSRTEHDHDTERPLNDEALRQWILADESLYNWARSEGVKI